MADRDLLHDPEDVQHDHRSITGGEARAAVFGASDGLVSNVSLVLGVAGADIGADAVQVTGLAGLVAGAISMAAGEWVSMRAQQELLERELDIERRELERHPETEAAELAALYRSRGLDDDSARRLAEAVAADVDVALDVHAREELGVDPGSLGAPVRAAASSFLAFAVGASLPVLPWFVTEGVAATAASLVLALVGAVVLGSLLAHYTGRGYVRSAFRQALIVCVASGLTYLIGAAVGVSVA
ncbi:MAG: VIT1/CCC1 transporter family protein [Actinomycetota bacterium]